MSAPNVLSGFPAVLIRNTWRSRAVAPLVIVTSQLLAREVCVVGDDFTGAQSITIYSRSLPVRPKNYVVEADTKRSVDEVWAAIIRRGKQAEADGRGKIIESNDTKRIMEVTDGVQTASLKVLSLEENKSRVTIVASLPLPLVQSIPE